MFGGGVRLRLSTLRFPRLPAAGLRLFLRLWRQKRLNLFWSLFRVIRFLIRFFLSCSLRLTSPLLLLLLHSSVGAPH